MVAVSKKINSIRPNSLSLGALEVMADRTGEPRSLQPCSEGLEGPQHMQSPYSHFTKNIAAILDLLSTKVIKSNNKSQMCRKKNTDELFLAFPDTCL